MKLDFSRPLLVLAPLAGFTDQPFRAVVKSFGVDLTVSEMISSNALAFGNEKTKGMLKKSPEEVPYSVQIAGSDPDILRRAVDVINREDGVDIVDLNCGCPVPKVVNNLQGSALLTDLKKMGKAIETIARYSAKEYTSVKMRLGFSRKNHIDIARVCEDSGADFIAVHGRTRSGKFKSPVDYDAIAEVKQSVSIPVIANGDIDSPKKAAEVLKHTGCDGIMIGRAAIGMPWLFSMIREPDSTIDMDLIRGAILEHFDKMLLHYGPYGAILFRKHLHAYSKIGCKGAGAFRNRINRISEPDEMKEEISNFFSLDPVLSGNPDQNGSAACGKEKEQ